MIRNDAETELPIMPPIVLKESNREEMAADVAAVTTDVMMTMLGMERISFMIL
jgi:phenylpyruvate tautomerase PptA (4-oxalocrotonate tautomerase family)